MGAPKSQKYPLTDTVRGIVYEGCSVARLYLSIYLPTYLIYRSIIYRIYLSTYLEM